MFNLKNLIKPSRASQEDEIAKFKRPAFRKALAFATIALLVGLFVAGPLPNPNAQAAATGKPDLKVSFFGLKSWGQWCQPGAVLFTFQVTVANVGTAPSPAIPGVGLVRVKDLHAGINWGNGAVLPAIPAGGSATVLIPVYYLAGNPSHVTGAAPHPFQATVDPAGLITELNEGNNTSGIILVDPRSLCRRR